MTKDEFIKNNLHEVSGAGAFYAYMDEHQGDRPKSKKELKNWTRNYNEAQRKQLGEVYDKMLDKPHPENCTVCRHKRIAGNVKHMHCDTIIPVLQNDNPVNMSNDNLWHEINE